MQYEIVDMLLFCFDWQGNDLPLHVPHLDKGQSMQMAVAVVTSKGLHISKSSNVSRHEGDWMRTLNGELFWWFVLDLRLQFIK